MGSKRGIDEGTIVSESAVIGAGIHLTGGTPVYEIVKNCVYRKSPDRPLTLPPMAVIIHGARPVTQENGNTLGVCVYTPIIVKYKDEKTDRSLILVNTLR